ncbi:MAG TPA: DNA-binding domain-containing protein [Planctomycetota bacterium]|nr:DNA-binding domain-containing protein [Planctomycetota bacterium]
MSGERAPLPLPLEGGAIEIQQSERASASVAAPAMRRPRRAARRASAPAARADLVALQRWFQSVVTDPASVESGVAAQARAQACGIADAADVERIVTPGPQMSALERLHIYHHAYHARLIDCLADDFPVLKHALGERAFQRLAAAVIARRPSRHPNLNHYGANLVAYVTGDEGPVPKRAFAADLARLEWALVEAIHAPSAPALDLATLQAIPAERWAKARFTRSPTLRVLGFAHPVNCYLQEQREGGRPVIPRRAWSATAVYRRGFSVWRMDLTRPMAGLLEALLAGRTLEQALATLERTVPRADRAVVESRVMRWFSEWVAGGFFAAVRA